MQQITFQAMGCQMMAALDSQNTSQSARLDEVPTWFETWEQCLSRFRPDSELSQVNRKGGTQPVSPLLAEVLREALVAQRQSGGLVNPLLLNALEAAGYDRNFGDLVESTSLTVFESQHDRIPNLKLDSRHGWINLPPNSRLDLGGIAKGWAADRAAQRLGKLAPALVDAGGDVAASAPQADGSPWPVGVADPLHPGEQLDLVMLWRGGVATSGRDYRRWQKNSVWQHHIIDPRTGYPAQTDVLSATVVAASARQAEIATKTVLILGSLDGLRWLDDHPKLAGLLVLEDGAIIPSHHWLEHVWR
jgi:thiamine biosynthesis lipoprotein